jgi:hypothetical protein
VLHRTWTRLNTHHQLFSILFCSLASFLGVPTELARQAGFGVDHECYGEVCLGESYPGQFGIPIFGWRRLCRITSPRNSSGRCHGASIRRNPGFGIAPQIVRRQFGHSNASGGFLHDVPNRLYRHPISPGPAYFVDPAEQSSAINGGRSEPIVEFASHRIGNRNRPNVASLANQIDNGPMLRSPKRDRV